MEKICAKIWLLSKPFKWIAPDRQDETQRPHPLHRTGLIRAFPVKGPSSAKEGAEYGQIETQTPQALQSAGAVSATVPEVWIVF